MTNIFNWFFRNVMYKKECDAQERKFLEWRLHVKMMDDLEDKINDLDDGEERDILIKEYANNNKLLY